MKKKVGGNCTRMQHTVLNNFWKQVPKKQQIDSNLPPISKNIHVRQTRHAGHSWRSKDKLIGNILQWTLTHGYTSVGHPGTTYISPMRTLDVGWRTYQEWWMESDSQGNQCNLLIVVWFQAFLSNTNNLLAIIWLQWIFLYNNYLFV